MTEEPNTPSDHEEGNPLQAVYRLFSVAVELPHDERIPWIQAQPDVSSGIKRQVIDALQADAVDLARDPAHVDSALELTLINTDSETPRLATSELPQIPNYEVIEEISRGGAGVVYRAKQLKPSRIVAIKMMKSGTFSSSLEVERFLNEANAASGLEHPSIVPIYEVGECSGEPFIAMKFIDGETFSKDLEDEVNVDEAIRKLIVVSLAIADAHSKGIIHRDIKPANILIDRHTGAPWVTDFGLAKDVAADSDLTAAGDVMGTPGYMAPEQAFGNSKDVSRAADVYGLGAVLYRILTGRPPIQSAKGDVARTLELIREHHVVPPREINRRVPRDLNTICVKSLESDPAQRYANAGEFADDLACYIEGEPIQARSPSIFRRARLWARHRPGLAATVITLFVFYAYYLLVSSNGLLLHDGGFSQTVDRVVILALANACLWQFLLSRTQGASWTLYGWATGEVTLLTALIMAGEGVESGLVATYFVLVSTSVLRCRAMLVWYVTALTMLGYGFLWIESLLDPASNIDPLQAFPTLLSLFLTGVVQFIALNRSSVSLESRVNSVLTGRTK